MKSYRKGMVFGLLAAVIFTVPAIAKPHHKDSHNTLGITISLSDRSLIEDYLRDNYRPHCPPGLAKKHNGCLPPGIARKYAMGRPLPPGIAAKRLPGGLLSQLHAPAGYEYAQVDKDVVLMNQATRTIADVVTLLSAVK